MIHHGVSAGGYPRVDDLSHLARALLARDGDDPGPLRLVQLRCKPGRGAVARLRAELEVAPRRSRVSPGAPLWLRVGAEETGGGPVGMSLHGFGTDPALPALGDACAPRPGGAVWEGLERAVALRLGRPVVLAGVTAVPVRYKPGSRCVLRYRLTVRGGEGVAVFGKLFAEPLQAVAVDAITRRLHAEQADRGEAPVVPRPLGAVESAGLALSAAGGEGDGVRGPLLSGTRMLLPRRHGAAAAVPVTPLAAAGEAIARLHTSSIGLREGLGVVRGAAREGARAQQRAALLGSFTPGLAPRLAAAAAALAERLDAADAGTRVPSHGGFKPSQLVYSCADRLVLTDLDGICLADPALDLGYLLAYLRPIRVWTGRPAIEAWYAVAAGAFLGAYARAMVRRGAPAGEVEASLRRVPLYEAALLLKIAARRPQRLNAPRPAELAAVLDEVGRCLAAAARAA